MTAQDALFPPDHELVPPGLPLDARPRPNPYICNSCGHRTLNWTYLTKAECEFCGLVWTRSSQLHHSEPWPDGY